LLAALAERILVNLEAIEKVAPQLGSPGQDRPPYADTQLLISLLGVLVRTESTVRWKDMEMPAGVRRRIFSSTKVCHGRSKLAPSAPQSTSGSEGCHKMSNNPYEALRRADRLIEALLLHTAPTTLKRDLREHREYMRRLDSPDPDIPPPGMDERTYNLFHKAGG
jgi:hypothetical protein